MNGFISYAHDDYAACVEMKKHLKGIERCYNIEFWSDTRIEAGDYWSPSIAEAIKLSRIHILLISPSFIASDYIFNHELPAINAKCEQNDLVLPVVIERCAWAAFVSVLQAIPTVSGRLKAVLEWKPRSNGFDAAREQITSSIASHFELMAVAPFSWGKS
jgi:hypothetical protein